MKFNIIAVILGIFLIGCQVYYPSEVDINNEAGDRVMVDISKNNTKVDITIKEIPRKLTVYSLIKPEPQFTAIFALQTSTE